MYTFSTCLFFFCFFQQYVHFSFSPLDCDLCKPQLQAGSIGIYFSKLFFSFKKNFLLTKKTGVPDLFFKTQIFFCHLFPFDKRKKRSKMKNTIRERRYPERFSPYFLYFKIWWRDGVLHVPGNSQFVIIAHSNFIYNTSGCNCIKTNTFKALNKYHNRGL